MIIIYTNNVGRQFFGEETVSSNRTKEIDYKVVETSMSRMLHLCDVLLFVIDGLNDNPLPMKNSVSDRS